MTPETPLNHPADADRIGQTLDALRRQALAELQGTATDAVLRDTAHDVHTHADDAEVEREDEVRLAEVAVDRRRLDDIDQARQRLAEGLYGICVDCGIAIAPERLSAQPTAIRCADCQTRHERRVR